MYDTLPKLRTATSLVNHVSTVSKEYKSGAKFCGEITDNKKSGYGTFIWPNGAKYIGDYKDNVRCGKGTQYWPDGSEYSGDFVSDLRHGKGLHKWSNGETYEGDFYCDRRHGLGTYTWPDGRVYDGPFYVDKKQGYGRFTFPDGRKFQGLYKDDEREGPGVLTYLDQRQDVGLWRRERLIKLCTKIDACFTMDDFAEFDNREYHALLEEYEEQVERPKSRQKSPFDDPEVLNDSALLRESSVLKSEGLDVRSAALNHDELGTKFYDSLTKTRETKPERFAWNNTTSMIKMQKHILLHQAYEPRSFPVGDVIEGRRSSFGRKGPLEELSEELIKAAMNDDLKRVERLLNEGRVDVDVSDNKGRTALMAAAVSWNQSIVNCLLDHGANVNKVSDEGISSLSACCVFFYPSSRFIPNSAEKSLENARKIAKKENSGTEIKQGNDKKEDGKSKNKQSPPQGKKSSPPSTKQQSLTKASGLTQRNGDDSDDPDADFDIFSQVSGDLPSPATEFASDASLRNYNINVTEQLLERCATQMSQNITLIGRLRNNMAPSVDGTATNLAIRKYEFILMEDMIRLLLKRGANPNASRVPMPALYFALKTADVEMVRQLLMKRASTRLQLSDKQGGLYPLHIAAAMPGEAGVQMTELLLNSLADPDARACLDDSYLSKTLPEEIWGRDPIRESSKSLLGGRTPLHIACARDDDHKAACKIVKLLLEHHANPDLMCNGHSPLSLAIASGNELAIDELLNYGADSSLGLTHGLGTALCVASSTEYEDRRSIDGRKKLLDKLVRAGANILAPVAIGPKRMVGTAVDYAYYMFNQDRRIAHVPYHALTPPERDIYNDRKQFLGHLGATFREKMIERERLRIEEEERLGLQRDGPSNFVYTGAGAKLSAQTRRKPGVNFGSRATSANDISRRPLFKYCYECGRSINVRLTACTRCKEVYFCSKSCKLTSWSTRHKDECVRVGGSLRESHGGSPTARKGQGGRVDSPTPVTDLENKEPTTVAKLTADVASMRNVVPMKGHSRSAGKRISLPQKTL